MNDETNDRGISWLLTPLERRSAMDEITDQDVAEANAMYAEWANAISRNPAALRELTDKFFVAVKQYNVARAKLDAVPEYVDYRRGYTDWDTGVFSFDDWCERFLAVQP